MKRTFLSFCAAAALAVSFTACNDTGTATSDKTDSGANSATTPNTTSNMPSSTMVDGSSYAAMADSVEKNSQQGYYLNAKTGKPYKSLKVDRTTGAISDDAGEPVWRYVDNRNWWVYGDNDMSDTMTSWNQVGEAKMEGEKLMYKGDADKWTDYDGKWKISDDGMKQKLKTASGDKLKIKTDEEGNTKIKVNDEKIKMDKDGKVIKD